MLVNTRRQSIEVRRRGKSKFWELAFLGPGDAVELNSIDISIPIEAIYENVILSDD